MSWKKKACLLTLALFAFSLSAPDALAKKKKKKRAKTPYVATAPMDDGRLDPAWFGDGLAFVETDEIDYFWVREGFSLDGKVLHMEAWEEAHFLGEDAADRDGDDKALARRLTRDMANIMRDGFEDGFDSSEAVSLDHGDLKVTGRITDCSTGNAAAKAFVGFGAGAGNVTLDLKMVDTASGQLMLAIHHRVVSGTSWSSTDSKFIKWVRKASEEMMEDGVWELYQDGDSVRK